MAEFKNIQTQNIACVPSTTCERLSSGPSFRTSHSIGKTSICPNTYAQPILHDDPEKGPDNFVAGFQDNPLDLKVISNKIC